MQTEARVAKAAAGMWWLFLLTGILWLLIALVVLRFNVTSIATVGALMGVVFLIAGVNEFMALGTVEAWKWRHVLLGVLFVGGSIWAFVNPIGAFYELAALLGFLLLFKGVFDISFAVITKEANELWWLGLVVGILEILLAFWASQQLFAPRAALILIWIGFFCLFRGIGEIVLAFHLRRAGRELAVA
jgi:uncharacterized membrane protein HdeD (DUF308 family)